MPSIRARHLKVSIHSPPSICRDVACALPVQLYPHAVESRAAPGKPVLLGRPGAEVERGQGILLHGFLPHSQRRVLHIVLPPSYTWWLLHVLAWMDCEMVRAPRLQLSAATMVCCCRACGAHARPADMAAAKLAFAMRSDLAVDLGEAHTLTSAARQWLIVKRDLWVTFNANA